jgi:uncharacterized protein YoxC
MHALSSFAPFLLQLGRTLPDTILTRQVATDMGFFQEVGTIANAILAIAVLLLALGLLFSAWNVRKASKQVHMFLDRAYSDLAPAIREANVIATDVREMTTIVKGNVREVQQTVAATNTRVLKAVREIEGRLDQFNAFLGLVQDEAESVFVSTASTVRGVRTGLQAVFDHDDLDLDDLDEELDDGYDDDGRALDIQRPEPRIRPKRPPERPAGT